MWLVTNFGYFSIVQKKGDGFLTVRARVRSDLEALKEKIAEFSVFPFLKLHQTEKWV